MELYGGGRIYDDMKSMIAFSSIFKYNGNILGFDSN